MQARAGKKRETGFKNAAGQRSLDRKMSSASQNVVNPFPFSVSTPHNKTKGNSFSQARNSTLFHGSALVFVSLAEEKKELEYSREERREREGKISEGGRERKRVVEGV